jgi:hypothetical protein
MTRPTDDPGNERVFARRKGEHVLELRVQNAEQEIRQTRGILNRIRFSWARRAEACIANGGRHFEQLL